MKFNEHLSHLMLLVLLLQQQPCCCRLLLPVGRVENAGRFYVYICIQKKIFFMKDTFKNTYKERKLLRVSV